MKNFYCLFLAVLVFVCGCNKSAEKKGAESGGSGEIGEILISNDPAVELGVILTDASLLELKTDGKMHWKADINAGDTVIWKNEEKEAPRAYDGQTRTFYRVEMDGDYWVQEYAIAGPARPAVITSDETILYTKPEITAIAKRGNITIPKYTLTAWATNDAVASEQFVMIYAWLEGTANPAVNEMYVKTENISVDTNDIATVKIARIASATKNAVARKELLKNAMKIAEGSRSFSSVVWGLNNDPALFELELTDNLERLDKQESYMIIEEKVNKRDFPSVNSNVVGTFSYGDTFSASLRTKKTTSLPAAEEGATPLKGYWIRAEDNYWVFSGYTKPYTGNMGPEW